MVPEERMALFNASCEATESKTLLAIRNGGKLLHKWTSFFAIYGLVRIIKHYRLIWVISDLFLPKR